MRTRRRRYGIEGEAEVAQVATKTAKIKFIQEVDYKMEIDDGETNQRDVKVIGDQPVEEVEKNNAFKKKLRKYSNMQSEGTYQQL